jgi:hypothetical protein
MMSVFALQKMANSLLPFFVIEEAKEESMFIDWIAAC